MDNLTFYDANKTEQLLVKLLDCIKSVEKPKSTDIARFLVEISALKCYGLFKDSLQSQKWDILYSKVAECNILANQNKDFTQNWKFIRMFCKKF